MKKVGFLIAGLILTASFANAGNGDLTVDGKLFLGTTSDDGNKLQVNGSASMAGTNNIPSPTSTSNGVLQLLGAGTNTALTMGVSTWPNYYSWIQSRQNNAVAYNPLVINPLGGNVGIGYVNNWAPSVLSVYGGGPYGPPLNVDSTMVALTQTPAVGGSGGLGIFSTSFGGSSGYPRLVFGANQGNGGANLPGSMWLGGIDFNGYSNSDSKYLNGAYIKSYAQNAWASNAASGNLDFGTSDGNLAKTATSRMRITESGNILMGTITDTGQKLQVNGSAYVGSTLNVGGVLSNANFYARGVTGPYATVANPQNASFVFKYGSGWGVDDMGMMIVKHEGGDGTGARLSLSSVYGDITDGPYFRPGALGTIDFNGYNTGDNYKTGAKIVSTTNGMYFGPNQAYGDLQFFVNNGASAPTLAAKITTAGNLEVSGSTSINGSLSMNTAGNGLKMKEGSNACSGSGTLAAGTVTVTTSCATTTSRIFVTATKANTTNLGALTVTSKAAGSFTVKSTITSDTTTFDYFIVQAF